MTKYYLQSQHLWILSKFSIKTYIQQKQQNLVNCSTHMLAFLLCKPSVLFWLWGINFLHMNFHKNSTSFYHPYSISILATDIIIPHNFMTLCIHNWRKNVCQGNFTTKNTNWNYDARKCLIHQTFLIEQYFISPFVLKISSLSASLYHKILLSP